MDALVRDPGRDMESSGCLNGIFIDPHGDIRSDVGDSSLKRVTGSFVSASHVPVVFEELAHLLDASIGGLFLDEVA